MYLATKNNHSVCAYLQIRRVVSCTTVGIMIALGTYQ